MENKLKEKHPKVHRYLFTVTTFSKLLAMFLFILLPFVGFYLGVEYQKKITVPTTSQVIIVTPIPTINPTATPAPTSCNTDADCKSGEKCMSVGPIIARQPLHKSCVKEGTAVPL